MNIPGPIKKCPDADAFADFVGGKLPPEDRRGIVEHMAICPECRAMATFGAPRPDAYAATRAARYKPLSLAMAVVVILGISGVLVRRWTSNRKTKAIEALTAAAATMDYRTTAARPSGGFRHKPLVAGTRGDPSEPNLAVLAAAASVEAHAHDDSNETRQALGIAQLVTGRSEDAVKTLTRLVRDQTKESDLSRAIRASTNGPLLGDLAAALHTSARVRDNVHQHLLALEATERAWRLARTREIAWNRALARETVNLVDDAVEAWEDFERLEPDAEWRREAGEHLDRLRVPNEFVSWRDGESLERALSEGRADDVATIVKAFPRQARVWAEGIATGTGQPISCCRDVAARNGALQVVGWALAQSGDPLIAKLVIEISDDDGDGRVALRYYREGNAAAVANNAAAAESFRRCVEAAQARPYLLTVASIRLASALYNANRMDEVLKVVQRVQAKHRSVCEASPSLAARLEWLKGLALMSIGRGGAALQAYQAALGHAERTSETETIGAVKSLIAEAQDHLHMGDRGWRARLEGLDYLYDAGATGRLHVSLQEAAQAAFRDEAYPHVAWLMTHRFSAVARKDGSAAAIAAADLWEAITLDAIDDQPASEAAFVRAEISISSVRDPSVRTRATANFETARAIVLADAEPRAALRASDTALTIIGDGFSVFRAAELRLARGVAYDRVGNESAAVHELETALNLIEGQRRELQSERQRLEYFDVASRVVETLLILLSERNEWTRAFEVAERTRARSLLDMRGGRDVPPLTVAQVRDRLPRDVLLVSWATLHDRTLVWTFADGRMTATSVPVAGSELSEHLAAVSSAFDREDDEREELARLHDLLFPPATAAAIQAHDTLVAVPDATIAGVPFSALYDNRTGEYLIEKTSVVVSPSVTIALQPRPISSARGAVLVGHNGSGADMAILSAVRREIGVLSAVYAAPVVLEEREATPARVQDAIAGRAILHIAAHAVETGNDQAIPALILADDELLRPAAVRADDIEQWELGHVQLVMIAACNTGRAAVSSSLEGPLSLTRAFLAAGAHNVVATLKPVDDELAAVVSKSFHSAYAYNANAAVSLRSAQLEMLRSPRSDVRRAQAWGQFQVYGSIR